MNKIIPVKFCVRCLSEIGSFREKIKTNFLCENCFYTPSTKKISQCSNFRKAAILVLGARCVICGFSDMRALQIDHKKGGGSKERKNTSQYTIYKKVYRLAVDGEAGDYQVLCANCNWIKRHENSESRNQYMV